MTEQRLLHGDRIQIGRAESAQLVFLTHDRTPDTGSRTGGTGTDASGIIGGFRQMAALLEALRGLGGRRVLDEVLTLVMDAAIDVAGAERGFLMMAGERGELEPKVARMRGRLPLAGDGFDASRKIPEQVFATAKAAVIRDLMDEPRHPGHDRTIAHGIRQVLCVPLLLVRYVDNPSAPVETQPIGVLYLDSREKGALLAQATKDALETLAAEAAVAIENARLYREAIEKRRIDGELRMASQIQQALLPKSRRRGTFYEATGTSIACRAIGGDFFEYIDMADGRFGFALGDVSGKGPPAALLTAMLQGILWTQSFAPVEPAVMMSRINQALLVRGIDNRFATIFFAILSPDGRLTYCNAGQNPPLLFSASGVRTLETGGMIVGLFEHATYEQEEIQLAAGDLLAVFSDGVSEALNPAGDEYGEARVQSAIAPNWREPSDAVPQSLLESVRSFAQGGAAERRRDRARRPLQASTLVGTCPIRASDNTGGRSIGPRLRRICASTPYSRWWRSSALPNHVTDPYRPEELRALRDLAGRACRSRAHRRALRKNSEPGEWRSVQAAHWSADGPRIILPFNTDGLESGHPLGRL